MKEELLRNRIVVGMLDVRASQIMQLKADLTLEKSIEIAKQCERQTNENLIIRKIEQLINYVNCSLNQKSSSNSSKVNSA